MSLSSKSFARAAVAAVLASPLVHASAHACSKVPVSIQRWTSNTVNFIGTARADTIRSGPGDVEYVVAGGHFGPARDRVVYGQKVSVERLPAIEQKMLPPGVRELILIPWDYDASCRPTPWARSAQWIPVGTRGIYNATLRAPEHWIKGVPTLDVMSPSLPYTGQVNKADSAQPAPLSIEELFGIVHLLPHPDSIHEHPEAATRPLLQWAEKNPELSRRAPARSLVWNAAYSVENFRMSNLKPDIAGTWRFVAEAEGDTPREFYARTEERPSSRWPQYPEAELEPWEIRKIEGFYVLAALSRQLGQLPTTCASRGAESYMAQRTASTIGSDGARMYAADLDLRLVNALFFGDSTFNQYKELVDPTRSPTDPMIEVLRGRTNFVLAADGKMHVSQSFVLSDRRTLVLRAERINNEVVRCEW